MGKVLKIIYCDICKKPTHRKNRQYTKAGQRPLCRECYRKYGSTFDWGHWP